MSNENREQQIRSKAKELGQKYFPDEANVWARGNIEAEYVESACVEMAEWLDQHPHWIPVEEGLPEERKVVWVRKHFNKEVLGEFDIYDSAAFCNGEFQCDNSSAVTHWMEIVNGAYNIHNDMERLVRHSVKLADALISELQKKQD